MKRKALYRGFVFILYSISLVADAPAEELLFKHIRNQRLIAHALGEVHGRAYTNSKEAFEVSYRNGYRLFEADLILTSDDILVARHSWDKRSYRRLGQPLPGTTVAQRLSHAQFLRTPIFGELTPIDVRGLLQLLQVHRDAYLITDTKRTSLPEIRKAFVQLTALGRKLGVVDRIIPQIYNEEMINELRTIDKFPNLIYTLYLERGDDEHVLTVIEKHRIQLVTIPKQRVTPAFLKEIQNLNAMTFTHTVNDPREALRYFAMGIDGLYSDKLLPAELPR